MAEIQHERGMRIVVLAITSVLGAMVLLPLPMAALELSDAAEILVAILLSALVFLFVSFGVCRVYGLPRLDLGFNSVSYAPLVQAALLRAVFMPITGLLAALVRHLRGGSWDNPQLTSLDVTALGSGAEFLVAVCVVALMPLLEEIFFRGIIFSQLRSQRGATIAIYGSAFVFALFHLHIDLVIGTFVLGVVMGFLRERSNSLWPAIIFHGTNNGLAWLLAHQGLNI